MLRADTDAVHLRDGSLVYVRPLRSDDKQALVRGFERLSDESRYRRFFSPIQRLTPSQLRYLTEIDHRDHEAIAAFEPGTGDLIGVARYVRLGERGAAAEAAVTVVDDRQGTGLGSELLGRLSRRAREEGIEHFTALVLSDNDAMLELLRGLGTVLRTESDRGIVETDVELAPDGPGERLMAMLRSAAAGRVRFGFRKATDRRRTDR